jgi:hypothetical protein
MKAPHATGIKRTYLLTTQEDGGIALSPETKENNH